MNKFWMIEPGALSSYRLFGFAESSNSLNQLLQDKGLELVIETDTTLIHRLDNIKYDHLIYLYLDMNIWRKKENLPTFPLSNYSYVKRVIAPESNKYLIEMQEDFDTALSTLLEWAQKAEQCPVS